MSFLRAPSKGSIIRDLTAYVRGDNSFMDRKLKKDLFTISEIDFDHIRHLHARTRQELDTLRYLRRNKEVAGVIKAKDDFPEVNIVHKHKDALMVNLRLVKKFAWSEPFMVNIDEDNELVKCYCEDVTFHTIYNEFPMGIAWNRFVLGKPNRMLMKVVCGDWKNSEACFRGGRLSVLNDMVWVNVYTEEHPRVLKANILDFKPGSKYFLKDLARDLPDGIELSPEYKTHYIPIFQFEKTIKSKIYFEHLKNRFDYTRFADIEKVMLGIDNITPQESVKVEAVKHSSAGFLTEEEEKRIRKLATHLGKSFDELRQEIIQARIKHAEIGKAKRSN